jgi:hypothetical protein
LSPPWAGTEAVQRPAKKPSTSPELAEYLLVLEAGICKLEGIQGPGAGGRDAARRGG